METSQLNSELWRCGNLDAGFIKVSTTMQLPRDKDDSRWNLALSAEVLFYLDRPYSAL